MTTDNKLHLGLSPLSGNIYLGKQKNGMWSGSKRDVTDEFLGVFEQKFKVNTSTTMSVDGVDKYRIIIVAMDIEAVVNGKPVK